MIRLAFVIVTKLDEITVTFPNLFSTLSLPPSFSFSLAERKFPFGRPAKEQSRHFGPLQHDHSHQRAATESGSGRAAESDSAKEQCLTGNVSFCFPLEMTAIKLLVQYSIDLPEFLQPFSLSPPPPAKPT